jgi:hypothetical protein
MTQSADKDELRRQFSEKMRAKGDTTPPQDIPEPEPVIQSNNGTGMQQSYIWQRPFRLRILAACLHFPDWYLKAGVEVIRPEYFDTKEEMALARWLYKFSTEYERVPVKDEVEAELGRGDDLMVDLLIDITDLLDNQANELEFAKNKAIEFAQYQAKTIAIGLGAQLRDEGKPLDPALRLIEEAEQIGLTLESEWRSPAEIDEYDFERLVWLIDGILKQAKVNLFFGESGCGKTWLIMDMCAHLALGKPFLGSKCTESFILWIDEENREDEMMERLYSFRLKMTPEERAKFDQNFMFRTLSKTCTSRFNLNDAAAVRRLVKQIQSQTDKPVMVVFDSMGAVSYSDENIISDNKVAIKIMNILGDMAVKTEATIAAIHHPTKEKSSMFGGVFMTNLVDLNVEICPERVKDDPDRKVLRLTSPKDRKAVFGEGFLVEFITDGKDKLYRAINPKFVRHEYSDIELAKSKSRQEKQKVKDMAGVWIRKNPERVLGLSRNKIATELAKQVKEGEGVEAGRGGWEQAIDALVGCGMYAWSNPNSNASDRKLITGEKYEEYARRKIDLYDFTK